MDRIRMNFNLTAEEKTKFQQLAKKLDTTNVGLIFELFKKYKLEKNYNDNFFLKKHERKTERFYILPTATEENLKLYKEMAVVSEIERVSIADLLYLFLKNKK